MNSMSFGDFMTVGGFIQKTVPGTTIIHSKQANRRQQVIQPVKTMKDNSRRFQKTPHRSFGQTAMKVSRSSQPIGWPAYHEARSPSAASYLFLRSTPLILRWF